MLIGQVSTLDDPPACLVGIIFTHSRKEAQQTIPQVFPHAYKLDRLSNRAEFECPLWSDSQSVSGVPAPRVDTLNRARPFSLGVRLWLFPAAQPLRGQSHLRLSNTQDRRNNPTNLKP